MKIKSIKMTAGRIMNYRYFLLAAGIYFLTASVTFARGTRLLRQPSISNDHIAFAYAGDIWIAGTDGSGVLRITSTQAV
ncbi:MAG TPA: hypothetical protein VJ963_10825, partial [Bacteroidales bacterium]|nr:hypothetical protein [Bacteroidales bacterium]